MSEIAERWNQLIDQLEPTMTAEWVKSARDHGEQPWIRLVLLVDAHDLLCRMGPTEKIAMTMADLAQGNDERQREGWEVRNARGETYLYCMTGQRPSAGELAILMVHAV